MKFSKASVGLAQFERILLRGKYQAHVLIGLVSHPRRALRLINTFSLGNPASEGPFPNSGWVSETIIRSVDTWRTYSVDQACAGNTPLPRQRACSLKKWFAAFRSGSGDPDNASA